MAVGYYDLPHGRVVAIDNHCNFPQLESALEEPNGLIAIGGKLDAALLLKAYQAGIFPWFNEGEPTLWWSPSPRMVLFPAELKISRSLSKTLKHHPFEIRFNSAFREVIKACANTKRIAQAGTWITEEIVESYCELHALGFAHSAEAWLDNKLVGGLYGVAMGKMFYGESMFHHVTDASKVAFVYLVRDLLAKNYGMIDCQMKTAHLSSLGAREITREHFIKRLKQLIVI